MPVDEAYGTDGVRPRGSEGFATGSTRGRRSSCWSAFAGSRRGRCTRRRGGRGRRAAVPSPRSAQGSRRQRRRPTSAFADGGRSAVIASGGGRAGPASSHPATRSTRRRCSTSSTTRRSRCSCAASRLDVDEVPRRDRRGPELLGARATRSPGDLGRRLGGAGVCVVSGAAYGIDAAVAPRRARRAADPRSRCWARASTSPTRARASTLIERIAAAGTGRQRVRAGRRQPSRIASRRATASSPRWPRRSSWSRARRRAARGSRSIMRSTSGATCSRCRAR